MSAGTLPTPDLDLFGDGPERDTVVRVLNGWHCTAQCAFMARCARRVFPLFLPPTSLPDILRLTMLGGYTSILTMVEAQAMRFEQPVALRIGQFARAQETATSAFVPVHRLESRDLTLLNDFVAWHFLESRLMPSERAARTVLAAGAATGLIADVSFLPAAALINRLAFEAALAGYQAGLPDPTDLPRPHPSGPDELESAVRSACRELRDAVAADLCALAIRSDWERINGLMAGATDGVLPALDPSETGPLGPLWPKVEPDWYRAGLFRHRELYASVGFGPVPAIP
ncbi:MAG TPA: hypothetical protein VKD90_27320, partial [Gemmataceae bacterium]|nr:hypothetical protein [Gemmataceae bacterium]